MLKVSVQDIMSEDVVSIKENATVGQAAHILLRFRINGLLLTKKNDKNNIVGVVTTTDLLRLINKAFSTPKKKLSQIEKIAATPVIRVASRSIFRINKDTNIKKALAIMQRKGIHTLPVYDENRLIGVIGKHDILNAAFA